jgi:hypothetical protein
MVPGGAEVRVQIERGDFVLIVALLITICLLVWP